MIGLDEVHYYAGAFQHLIQARLRYKQREKYFLTTSTEVNSKRKILMKTK